MEVSGQVNASTDLFRRKGLAVGIEKEAGWAPETFRTI
jgi:hypothetical protein